jgi:hypothetical protein
MKKIYVLIAVILAAILIVSGFGYYLLFMKPKHQDHELIETHNTGGFVFPENFTTNETIIEYLVTSGDYLLDKIEDDGRWVYQYDTATDDIPNKYNILRHAGTTYSLALIFKYTQDLRYYNGTILTLNYLMNERLIFEDLGDYEIAYIEYKSLAKLGGVALTLLGLTEVIRMDPRVDYDRELDGMGNFLLMMQYPSGKFQCFYKTKEDEHNDYYPGEALLALAKIYDLTGEKKYLDALELGFGFYNDYYKAARYTAYTPWATEAMVYGYDWLKNDSYQDMCFSMANSCLSGQYEPGDSVNPLYIGGWGSDPASNAASRIEGVVDSYLLAKRTGDTNRMEKYYDGSVYCGYFLINLQFNETDVEDFPAPERALGGTPLSHSDPHIRIDYVQHAVVVLAKILVYTNTDNNV